MDGIPTLLLVCVFSFVAYWMCAFVFRVLMYIISFFQNLHRRYKDKRLSKYKQLLSPQMEKQFLEFHGKRLEEKVESVLSEERVRLQNELHTEAEHYAKQVAHKEHEKLWNQIYAQMRFQQTQCYQKIEFQIAKNETEKEQFKEHLKTVFLDRYRQGFENQVQSYPWLAQQYADFLFLYDERTAKELEHKSRPALRAAEEVRRIASEKRDLQKQLKSAQYQLNYYEALFPWLEDFKELDPHEGAALVTGAEDSDEYVSYHEWLSPEEYQELPDVEKFQLALDRYIHKHKTNWQAGIEYERYVGYSFEQMGYTVQYTGALEKLEDMGRDLIAQKKGGTYIIQCKRWAVEKTIHEKHVFQLFGSYVHYQIETDERNIHCALYTTAPLSDTAQKAADMLDVTVSMFPMKEYPLVKCHIADNGEKIYHLPFDLQYDRIRNRQNGRLIYVDTVKEAEDLGYRRAYRWRGGHASQ